MRSFHFIFILIIALISLIVKEEGNTFTVSRPRESMIKTSTLPPGPPGPLESTSEPLPTKSSFNYGPGGDQGSTGVPSPTVSSPVVPPPYASPSPSPEPIRSKFPTFILTVSIITVLIVIFWYFTRNVNFRRLYKRYFS